MTTETILILGGSFAGISAAHYALRHTIPSLPRKAGTTYTVTMVNPTKDYFWRIAGARAIVSKQLMPPSKLFYPIEPAFAYAKDIFTFVQGTATAVDAASHTVTVTTATGEQRSVPYVALIIATGFSTPSALFTLSSDRKTLEDTYDTFQKALVNAKKVVIGGAGPVGVETAGEVSEFLNGKPGFLASGPKNPRAKVTLICAERKMLPVLRESISKTAEKYLKQLGCQVVYNTKVVSATPKSGEGENPTTAKTTVVLSDGKTIEADIYIDATGTRPNTSFLPKEWLDTRNRVSCHPKTLRVDKAAPRVYAVGDVGSYTRGGVMDLADAVPVAMTNLKTDLIAYITGKPPGPDRYYKANLSEQQACPIGTQKGVGAFNGYRMPSQMVWFLKGRDYLVGMLATAYLNGDQFKKESKWKPQPVVASGQAGLSRG
jgi:NADH dehydrogenase FAD-containing subunit